MSDHVCREVLCLIQKAGNVASFWALAYEAYLTWGSAQCGRSLHILPCPCFLLRPFHLLLLSALFSFLFSSQLIWFFFPGKWILFRFWEICVVQQKQGKESQELLTEANQAESLFKIPTKHLKFRICLFFLHQYEYIGKLIAKKTHKKQQLQTLKTLFRAGRCGVRSHTQCTAFLS